MHRNTKILVAAGLLQIVIAAGKSGARTPDAFIEAAKSEAIPLVMNLGGLYLLLKFIPG